MKRRFLVSLIYEVLADDEEEASLNRDEWRDCRFAGEMVIEISPELRLRSDQEK